MDSKNYEYLNIVTKVFCESVLHLLDHSGELEIVIFHTLVLKHSPDLHFATTHSKDTTEVQKKQPTLLFDRSWSVQNNL